MTNEERIMDLLNQLHLKVDHLQEEIHSSRKDAKKAKKAIKVLSKALGQNPEEEESDDK